jgi:hypothetical protein
LENGLEDGVAGVELAMIHMIYVFTGGEDGQQWSKIIGAEAGPGIITLMRDTPCDVLRS